MITLDYRGEDGVYNRPKIDYAICERSLRSLKILKINVIQLITFYMNSKLTNVTPNCTVFIFNVNITDFIGENYIRIGRNMNQYLQHVLSC